MGIIKALRAVDRSPASLPISAGLASRTPTGVNFRDFKVTRRRRTVIDIERLDFGGGSHVLAGANGSGKSTFLRTVAGLFPYAGEIIVGDGSPKFDPRDVAYMPQYPSGLNHLTALDAVLYAKQVTRSQSDVGESLDAVGLLNMADRKISTLSGGESRLVYLAMTLVQDAPILLLDEPTAGLDASHRVALRRAILGAATERTVITATHAPDDLEELGHRIVILREGHVAFTGSGADFLATTAGTSWDDALMAVEAT